MRKQQSFVSTEAQRRCGGIYQAQRAQVRVAQNALSYGKMDKSKP
jgi:hypothetical protein